MSKTYLLGFKTTAFLSTRGPGDMLPRASTTASIYETPILPRLETIVGLITGVIIEAKIKMENVESTLSSAGYSYSNASEKWVSTVHYVFTHYLKASRVTGPVLIVGGDDGKEYYVNIGLGLLKINKLGNSCFCLEKYRKIAENTWNSIIEANVLKKYEITREVEEELKELVDERCLVYPYPLTSTGISLDRVSKNTRHGLIYGYILQDYMGLTHGKSYTVGILVEADTNTIRDNVGGEIVLNLGPRGRPAKLVEEPVEEPYCLGFSNKFKTAITPLPLKLVENAGTDNGVAVVHPLRIKPLIIQLAKSTKIRRKRHDKVFYEWAKTSMEPAYQPGSVVVEGKVRVEKIDIGSKSLELFYTI